MERAIEIAVEREPVSVRGVAYVLFGEGWIESMKASEVGKVGYDLVDAREMCVDETIKTGMPRSKGENDDRQTGA